MKKKEFIFIGVVLFLAVALWGIQFFNSKKNHDTITITINGEVLGTYSLKEDQIISIGTTNVCEIKDGCAFMIEANCPDHLCIHQKAIDSSGGTIICLPNKVVIEGDTPQASTSEGIELDAVT